MCKRTKTSDRSVCVRRFSQPTWPQSAPQTLARGTHTRPGPARRGRPVWAWVYAFAHFPAWLFLTHIVQKLHVGLWVRWCGWHYLVRFSHFEIIASAKLALLQILEVSLSCSRVYWFVVVYLKADLPAMNCVGTSFIIRSILKHFISLHKWTIAFYPVDWKQVLQAFKITMCEW